MKAFAIAAAAALLAGGASAATFTYEIDTSTLYQTPGFSEIAFGDGTSYGPGDYTITGSFDMAGDFANGFSASAASVNILTSGGESLFYDGTGRIDYYDQFESLSIRTDVLNGFVSSILFYGIKPAAVAAGAITAEILTGATESSFGIYPAPREPGIDLVSLEGPDAVTVTSGNLEGVAPSPVPVPAALPLLALALGGLGFVGSRRTA